MYEVTIDLRYMELLLPDPRACSTCVSGRLAKEVRRRTYLD